MNGARDLQRVRVAVIEEVARDVLMFRLSPEGATTVVAASAGAHVDVHLPGGTVRQYSLLLGMDADHYVIAVKKNAGGRGGSLALHAQALIGHMLQVSLPRNHFPLVEDGRPSVLIAGGIGITPLWSMALRLEALGQPYTLHYACRSRADVLFHSELATHPQMRLHVDDEAGTMLDVASLCGVAPADTHLYCCGPAPMLAAFKAATADRPRAFTHWEDFAGTAGPLPHTGFTLELARSQRRFDIRPGQRIVDALRDAGLPVSVSCEQGMCGACETTVLQGQPQHGCQVLSPEEREAGSTMMICCGGSLSETLVLDL